MTKSTLIACGLFLTLGALHCGGGDDDDAPGAGGAGPGPGSGGGNASEPPPPPAGELAAGWQKAFNEEPAGVSCDQSYDEMVASGAPRLSFGKTTIFVGFQQYGNNQDPVFRRFDDGVERYCEHHEKEPPDGRAYGITWDGGPTAYVVYSIVGGGSAFDALGKGQWLDRYGDGGASAAVSFVGEVETEFGTVRRGTFVIAKKKDGKTNTHRPADAVAVLPDGGVEFRGGSAFQPMNPDKSIMECSGYPFHTKYVFSPDLKSLLCSSSTNCTAKQPCP